MSDTSFIPSVIKNVMNDRASPGCGRQGNARGCDTHVDITPTSIILIISIHNPSWVQESVVETKKNRCLRRTYFVDV